MIEDALKEARTELIALRGREAELEELISRAESALQEAGGSGVTAGSTPRTLHEALSLVLRENGNEWMTARELADAVTERRLYRKRDGTPVEANQVHARTNNYAAVFEKEGARIRLREEAAVLSTHPASILVFRDDDSGFFEWLDENPDAYFINSERSPKPNYLVLHLAPCMHFDRRPELHWTKEYVKICSASRPDLEEWAAGTVGGEVTLCRTCFG